MNNNIHFFCPHWGSEHLPFKTFLENVRAAGYNGVEMSLPLGVAGRNEMVGAIKKHGLALIAQHWETVDADFKTHRKNYIKRLKNLAAAKPLFINSQTGKDYYSMEQNCQLIDAAAEIAAATGVNIVHETHRGKFSFAAHVTQQYLLARPALQLCLDVSHWCCVAETMLHDQEVAVEAAIANTRHLHGRVGFTQGPQVMDPRAPENQEIVDTHIGWWQRVADLQTAKNQPVTITTEFGPAPYLPHLPYTGTPLYSQWDVNLYMLKMLRKRLL